MQALIQDNEQMREGQNSGHGNSIMIENELLKEQLDRVQKVYNPDTIEQYEKTIQALQSENQELLQRAATLSSNLKSLAVELEHMREQNERQEREITHLKKKINSNKSSPQHA